MAYSIQTAVSDGTLEVLDLSIKYMDKSHIFVYIDDVLIDGSTYSYVWLTDTRIQVVPAVASGSTLKVIRKTLTDEMWHEFSKGARFSTTSMDENFEQLLFLAQEYAEGIYVSDFYTDIDMHLRRILNLADPVNDGDAVNLKTLKEYLPNAELLPSIVSRVTAEEGKSTQLARQGIPVGNKVLLGFDATGLPDGAWVHFAGRDTVGDGGGGVFRYTIDGTLAANGVTVFTPTGGGRLIREDLLSATPRQAGATGGADDTLAITRLMQANISVDMPAETYTATPINGSTPAITRDYARIVGGNLKVKAGTYATGNAGDIKTYGFASLNGNGAVAFGTSFDGNGQATLLPYQPTLPNAYFYPFMLYGNKKGQKVIGTHSTGAGGHGIEGSQGSLMVMADNTAELHNGIGTTNTDGVVMSGMVSADTTDSHYYSNSNDSVAAVGLVGRNTTGGGGIDIAGGSDVVVGASSFANSKKHGAWVLKSPNTSALYDRVTLVGLHSYNNCLTPDNEQAEVVFGDQAHLADAQGNDGAVLASHLFPRDTPSTAGFNNAVWIHPKATRTSATGLVISPDDALLENNQPMIKDLGSIRPIVAHNSCHSGTGSTSGKVYYDATPVGYSHYAYNVNMRIHPLSKVPSAMEASDAVWPYHIVRNLTKAGIRLFRVDYFGGLCHDVIEVTLSQTNDNGAACYRIVLRGANGITTTNLGATLVWSAGTNPPQLTVSTGTGTATVSANTAAAGFDNELCAFDIRIVSPQDEVVRFTPIFAV